MTRAILSLFAAVVVTLIGLFLSVTIVGYYNLNAEWFWLCGFAIGMIALAVIEKGASSNDNRTG